MLVDSLDLHKQVQISAEADASAVYGRVLLPTPITSSFPTMKREIKAIVTAAFLVISYAILISLRHSGFLSITAPPKMKMQDTVPFRPTLRSQVTVTLEEKT